MKLNIQRLFYYLYLLFNRTTLFFIGLYFCSSLSWAQELSIVDEEADWEANATWDASGDWDMGTVPTTGITRWVTIQGDIFVLGSLDFSHNNFGTGLTVLPEDTLTIFGDLTFTGATMTLDIQSSGALKGVLKVLGNLDTNDSFVNILGDGVIVITGDFILNGSSLYTDSGGDYDLYVDGNISGTSSDVTQTQTDAKNFDDGTTDDLESNHLDLYNEIQVEQPVVLLNFEARVLEQKVRLDWATASEENFDHFEIQKSNDGTSFGNIGQVSGHGNSSQKIQYDFSDHSPSIGTSYYRLKAVDYDGSFEIFESVRIDRHGSQSIGIFPNPIDHASALNVAFQNEILPKQVAVFDAMGKIVFQEIFEEKIKEWRMHEPLVKGVYLIRVQTADQTLTKKFLVN